MTESPPLSTKPPLLVICGPTASGKTDLALALAEELPLEVISADSRQVYRQMDIGTAKASVEERRRLPHHLIDVVDPDQEFSAADFERLGRHCAGQISRRGHLPAVVGGTGLYIRAMTEGLVPAPGAAPELRRRFRELEDRQGPGTLYRLLQEQDPELAARLEPGDSVRIIRGLEVFAQAGRPLSQLQREHAFSDRPFRTLKIGLAPEREELYRRIDRRSEQMFEQGLAEEVRCLIAQGYGRDSKALGTLGYRECLRWLDGELDRGQALELLQRNTRRYAKRQLTWFRQDGEIIWFDSCREFARIRVLIDRFYAS